MEFIQKNIFLFAVAFISGAMLLWPLLRRGAGGPWVDTMQATQLMNRSGALVIDVRDAADFAKGHILGARSFPLTDLERRAGELDKHKEKPLIVHCGSGTDASKAIALLRRLGFANLHNLTGGYAAWQQAGMPVEK